MKISSLWVGGYWGLLVLTIGGGSVFEASAADHLVKLIPDNGCWSISISGPAGGASEELYSKIQLLLETRGQFKAQSKQEGKWVIQSLSYDNLTVVFQTENLLDPAAGAYGIQLELDPKVFGYADVCKLNTQCKLHLIGPIAKNISDVLGQFYSWKEVSPGRWTLQGKDIQCDKINYWEKDRLYCVITFE